MAFGISPDVLALTPAQILADEAEHRRQALQERLAVMELNARNAEAGAQRFQQGEQFKQTLASSETRAAAEAATTGRAEAFDLQKWVEEQNWKKGEPGRQEALARLQASLRPKSVEEQIYGKVGPLSRQEMIRKLGADSEPKEAVPAGLTPSGYAGGKVTYGRPEKPTKEPGMTPYQELQRKQAKMRVHGALLNDLATNGEVTATDEGISNYIESKGFDPDDPIFADIYTKVPEPKESFWKSRLGQAIIPGRAKKGGFGAKIGRFMVEEE